MYEERICAAEDHVSFIPLAIDIPISGWRFPLLLGYLLTYMLLFLGAERITMSLSGFDQSQIYGLKRLLRALGD